jgi:diguanylate cyclase (GGDEF)-like protein
MAEVLRQRVEETVVIHNEEEILITVSVGVSQSKSGDQSVDDIYIRSDSAMYNAKKNGRNRVESN